MNQSTNVVRGTVRPDGTLELAERLTLPAGDVVVTVQTERESAGSAFQAKEGIDMDREGNEDRLDVIPEPLEGYGPYLARIRAEREAEGYPFRSQEEIDGEMEALRDWPDRSGDAIRNESDVNNEPTY